MTAGTPRDPQTLLSVPPALSPVYHQIAGKNRNHPFVTHDPPELKLGSGGGTAHLLTEAWKASGKDSFQNWLRDQTRILLHAGGQSRRLPAYAPGGKALMPVPVFRWSTGQRLDQTLMDTQLPLLRELIRQAPSGLNTLVASGDVLVWNEARLPAIPDVDVVCVGLWNTPEAASNHGVFFTPRSDPGRFEYMLQKPPASEILERSTAHLFLLDVGIWLFSDRAIQVLMEKCGWDSDTGSYQGGTPRPFDLYSAFGEALGESPHRPDPEISALRCAILPLGEAEFYHFGTSNEMVTSALALQNRVHDQRKILSPLVKPHPAIFVQNAHTPCPMDHENRNVWIENACLGPHWTIRQNHVLTGIPENDWHIDLPEGICLDVVPVKETAFAVRMYGFTDAFRGDPNDPETRWMESPCAEWFASRGLPVPAGNDIQTLPLFPICEPDDLKGDFIQWLLTPDAQNSTAREQYLKAEKLSAETLAQNANLTRLAQSRRRRLALNSLPALARHSHRSVFYQVDMEHMAELYKEFPELEIPDPPAADGRLFAHIHNRMFTARVRELRGEDGKEAADEAFSALREAVIDPYRGRTPAVSNTLLPDQVIWARSPVRLDLAGGWTDTPPYCYMHGGRVVNIAVELNGQPPIQVFARVGDTPGLTLRSIDLGISQTLTTYEDVATYAELGSGFSIPKASLALAGFHPEFQKTPFPSLQDQLKAFGGGIELSLLCAVPKGSGLGTSSILAATVLGALSELCGLGWDLIDIGNRTLALEQMLTSGGGWQDQFGGITRGLKLLKSDPGLDQTPDIRWLPDHVFTDPVYKKNFLLYYTGITRVAKGILGEIVRGMFLNREEHIHLLAELGRHAEEMYGTLQTGDVERIGQRIARTWELNRKLDPGTNPPAVQAIVDRIKPQVRGFKLLGAGGGGYLLMVANDATAAARIRQELEESPPNPGARFVDFDLSDRGLQITRS